MPIDYQDVNPVGGTVGQSSAPLVYEVLFYVYLLVFVLGVVLWVIGRVAMSRDDLIEEKKIKFERMRKWGMGLVSFCVIVFLVFYVWIRIFRPFGTGNI
jgi:hypothetical protein